MSTIILTIMHINVTDSRLTFDLCPQNRSGLRPHKKENLKKRFMALEDKEKETFLFVCFCCCFILICFLAYNWVHITYLVLLFHSGEHFWSVGYNHPHYSNKSMETPDQSPPDHGALLKYTRCGCTYPDHYLANNPWSASRDPLHFVSKLPCRRVLYLHHFGMWWDFHYISWGPLHNLSFCNQSTAHVSEVDQHLLPLSATSLTKRNKKH